MNQKFHNFISQHCDKLTLTNHSKFDYVQIINDAEKELYNNTVKHQIPFRYYTQNGGYQLFNNSFKLKRIDGNVSKLSFNTLYPKIILSTTNNEKFTYPNFHNLFNLFVKNHKSFSFDSKERMFMKIFINMTYGMLIGNTGFNCSCDIGNLVYETQNKLYEPLINCFRSNIIYIDTDMIFIHNMDSIKNEFKRELNQVLGNLNLSDLSYDLATHEEESFVFIGKKRYAYGDINLLKTIGFRKI